MSLANGWLMFRVQPLAKFERSAKVLKKGFKSKRQQQQFVDVVTGLIRALVQEPRHPDSRLEPIPKGVVVPPNPETHPKARTPGDPKINDDDQPSVGEHQTFC
jgi:hypothetical protein